jgi:hypothetical protein
MKRREQTQPSIADRRSDARSISHHLRVAKGALLLVLAPVFGILAYESLSKLWGYRDSPTWIYITYGTVAALLAVVCLTAGVRSLRRG